VYFRHRPITDVAELRVAATSVARMNGSDAQARAIDILARQPLSDREPGRGHAFVPVAASLNVQRAIAGHHPLGLSSDRYARNDPDAAGKPPQVLQRRRHHRILIRRLEAS
jgi:hypothetical protein